MNEIILKMLVYSWLLILCGCASKSGDIIDTGLSGEEFRAAFLRDCEIITGIEEFHTSTWYTVNGTNDGQHTKDSFSLEEMSSWLRACGRNPDKVTKILE